MATDRLQRRLAAILAADIVGYSRLVGKDEEGTLSRLKSFRGDTFDRAVAAHGGRIVKTMGDGWLVEFASAVDAVRCAAALQDGKTTETPFRLRIGVNLGDVVIDGDDILGDGVNIASRLEGLAEPGGICISAKVFDEVGGKVDIAFEDIGTHHFKNIERPIRTYRVASFAPPKQVAHAATHSTATAADKPGIAVMAFDNMSGDPAQEYFSDGISEDVITDLSKLSALMVIARNSSFSYKGKAVNLAEVARELGVSYVLEGSVRKAGNRVRVTAQLIDGTTGGHVWAERYDRELTDIFAVQDEITGEIVKALTLTVTRDERKRIAGRGTADLDAYDAFIRGRDFAWRMTKDANAAAKAPLLRAIELDPKFSAPHAILSHVHEVDYLNQWGDDPAGALDRSEAESATAISLNPDDPMGHWMKGFVHTFRGRYAEAVAAGERTIALDPNFAAGYLLLGAAYLWQGRPAESVAQFEATKRLDPYFPDVLQHYLARARFQMGDYDAAADLLEHRVKLNASTDVSRVLLAACRGHLGEADAARAMWNDALRLNPSYSIEFRRATLPAVEFECLRDGLAKAGIVQ